MALRFDSFSELSLSKVFGIFFSKVYKIGHFIFLRMAICLDSTLHLNSASSLWRIDDDLSMIT